jgi:hypothetical protein
MKVHTIRRERTGAAAHVPRRAVPRQVCGAAAPVLRAATCLFSARVLGGPLRAPVLGASCLAAASLLAACGGGDSSARPPLESEPGPVISEPPPVPSAGLDVDGVVKLYPDAPGSSFRLGDIDPNLASGLTIEEGVRAIAGVEGGLAYWTVDTYPFEYTEGAEVGKTARLHISSPGASQMYDWQSQSGFIAGPDDLGDQEFTAYVRVHGIFDAEHAAFELKIRGGAHSDDNPPLASCSLMTFATAAAPGVSRFGKELDHPLYDYVNLPPRFNTALGEGRWYGLKLVSYVEPGRSDRVLNRLYVDDDPFGADGVPRNDFRLLAEYVDRAGVSTGRYDRVVDWRGFLTTLRIDGVDSVDIARLSARAIEATDVQ